MGDYHAQVTGSDFRQGRHRLGDLMVEPMSFDRIGNLGNSSMKGRLQEEVRLVELAQSTRVRYTDMGVFSAVAGNQ